MQNILCIWWLLLSMNKHFYDIAMHPEFVYFSYLYQYDYCVSHNPKTKSFYGWSYIVFAVRLQSTTNQSTVLMHGTFQLTWRSVIRISLIARFMGQHGAHLSPTGPRWAPCWPHELGYPGCIYLYLLWILKKLSITMQKNITLFGSYWVDFCPSWTHFNIRMLPFQHTRTHLWRYDDLTKVLSSKSYLLCC